MAVERLHANNGMETVHKVAVADVAMCLTRAFAGSVVRLQESPTIFRVW